MKKKMSKFKKITLIYILILIIISIIFIVYVVNSLKLYESNQTEEYIENLILSSCTENKCDIEGISNITKSEIDKNESIAKEIKEILESADLKYESTNLSDDEAPTYTIYANDKEILEVTLSSKEKVNKLLILSFYIWDGGTIKSKITEGFYNYTINVPSDYKVIVNDTELNEDYLVSDEENDLLELASYIDISYQVTYQVSNLYSVPDIKILDSSNNEVEYETLGSTINVNIDYEEIESSTTALAKITDAPDIMGISEMWSKFLTQDLSGSSYGFYTMSEYLVKDSALYKYAKSWATGIDITFTSKHTLSTPAFSNELMSNFIIYNDNAFSCEVYLVKNMIIKGSKHEDVMHDRLYFVKLDGSWKLLKMKAITGDDTSE